MNDLHVRRSCMASFSGLYPGSVLCALYPHTPYRCADVAHILIGT